MHMVSGNEFARHFCGFRIQKQLCNLFFRVLDIDRNKEPVQERTVRYYATHGKDVFKVYRREYKKRFDWIKAGRIEPQAFYAWSEQAREKKAQCEEEVISLEEFAEWLKK